MLHAALLCAGLLATPPGTSPSPQDLGTYDALKHKAGEGAQAQVGLALWCEAHGLEAKRLEHLAQAVRSDPGHATARGLLGLVRFGDRWERPETLGERLRADEGREARMAEYHRRRGELDQEERDLRAAAEPAGAQDRPEKAYAARLRADRELAPAHAGLGLWCRQNGLEPEALAHFTMAVHLDPTRDASWRHLGYVKRNGRWTSPEQAADDEKEQREQRQADRHWEPLLRKWKAWLIGSPAHREQAEARLAAVTDPRAIPALVKVFGTGSEGDLIRLVGALERIDDPRSSRALAELAVKTDSQPVWVEAIAALGNRPRRDYAGPLVERIRGPIRYELKPLEGPGSTGALVLDTPHLRLVRGYDAPPVFEPGSSFRGYAGYDANGLPIIVSGVDFARINDDRFPLDATALLRQIEARTAQMIAAAQIKAQAVQQRMAADVYQVEMANQQAKADNARIIPVLRFAAGAPADLKEDEDTWHVWWYDTLGYKYRPAPKVTIVQDVSPILPPPPKMETCFAAGTMVRTLDGPRPIESIRVGDQVLAQDESSGALAFQPVVFVHHNPPGKTLRVSLSDGTSVVSSVYHRFWRVNQGWAMARELKPGDVLRTLGGRTRVEKVEPDATQPVYNLDMARSRTFFAGANPLLVHDNTLPDHRLKPFDALPVVEAGRTGVAGDAFTSPRSPAP